MTKQTTEQLVHIPAETVTLEGELILPKETQGVVAFAHGSGSSRHSPRNTFVAGVLQSAGLGTLLFDLLTRAEDIDYETRFDIALLTRPQAVRLVLIGGTPVVDRDSLLVES